VLSDKVADESTVDWECIGGKVGSGGGVIRVRGGVGFVAGLNNPVKVSWFLRE